MEKRICVKKIDDVNFVQFEKKGVFTHSLFNDETGSLIPALDVAAFAFPQYKRQEDGTNAPNAVLAFASYLAPIQVLQATSIGSRVLREVYFLQQQPCQKFPTSIALCDYNDLQNLQHARAKRLSCSGKDKYPTKKDSEKQVLAIGKLMDFLKQCNEKHGFKRSATVSAEEYDKLLKEVECYRQYFAKTAAIRQQMGITFPVQEAS